MALDETNKRVIVNPILKINPDAKMALDETRVIVKR